MSTLLEGINLKKRYRQGGQSLEVLKGVDLSIRQGEMVAVVGPSGSGKSTLLNLLGGLDTPTAGEVRFEGKSVSRMSDRELAFLRNRNFGFVFQFYHLVPELTALENVALPGWIANGSRSSRGVFERAEGLLTQVGLGGRLHHRPPELSGGEQQRVAIARALVNNPMLVFCDEPTGNLDSETGLQVLNLLVQRNRKEGTTFLIVTHELKVSQTAGRIFTLKDGRLWH